VVGLDDTVSVTVNFLSKVNHGHVIGHLTNYIRRRKACERILGRKLRAKDNLMKYCCHGGQIPVEMAKHMLSLAAAGEEGSEDSGEHSNVEGCAGDQADL